eukprot:CCRYP_000088-RA/>CCRYP_000088-RA protein AED:0.45 eAED:0.64 QI:0/0/0/1/1/1/2/0/155
MGLDTDFAAAEKAVETAKIEAELAKQDYVTVRNAEKKKKGNKQEAPGLESSRRCGFAVATAGAKPFELYGNLLSDEARQPWEKIIKAQVTKAPWEDIKGVPHHGDSHEDLGLVSRVRHVSPTAGVPSCAGEALKYYITNTLKSPTGFRFVSFCPS